MEILYLLIPLSLLLLGVIVWVLLWAVRSGQYDDLEGPAHRILFDEERVAGRAKKQPTGKVPAEKYSLNKKSRSQL